MMDRAGAELGVNLAVSLHAVRDDLRDELVPLNRKYPIAELMAACRRYPGASNARRITFEYVMLQGVNDTPGRRARTGAADRRHAREGEPDPVQSLARQRLRDQHAQRRSTASRGSSTDAGFASPVRSPRGRDILAACGQLRTESRRTRPAE